MKALQNAVLALKAHGWSDERIGAELNVSYQTVRRWRRGTCAPQNAEFCRYLVQKLRSMAKSGGKNTVS